MKVNTAKLERELNEPRTIKRALETYGADGRFFIDNRSCEDPIIKKIVELLNPEIENKIGVALTLFNQLTGAGYDFGYQEGQGAGYDFGYQEGRGAGYNFGYQEGHEDGYEKGYDAGNDTWEEVYGGALGYNEWEAMGR